MDGATPVKVKTGCMWKLFEPEHAEALTTHAQMIDGRLHVYLRASTNLQQVEAALVRAARTEGVRRTLYNLVLATPSLLFGVIVMVLVALSGVFGGEIADFLAKHEVPTAYGLVWGALSLALGALLIGYAPQLLSPPSAERDNDFVRGLKLWLNPGRRSVARIARTLRSLKRRRAFGVTIWNPIGPMDAAIRAALIEPCLRGAIPLDLIVHTDEQDNVRDALSEIAANPVRSAPAEAAVEYINAEDGAPARPNTSRQLLGLVLDANEMAMLALVLACSTYCFSAAWQEGLARSQLARKRIVATALAEHVLVRFRAHFGSEQGSASIGLQAFVQRCLRDYRLLERQTGARDVTIAPEAAWPRALREDDRVAVAERLIAEDRRRISETVADPTALFILLGKQPMRDPGDVAQNILLERFSALALRYEAFGYAAVVSEVLLDAPKAVASDGGAWTERFYGLSIEALRDWAAVLQAAGKFATALAIVSKLKSVARVDYAVEEGRLLERLGRAPEGIVALEEEYALFRDFPGKGYASQVDPQEHSERFLRLALRYHLQCAWIIVSGRLDDRRQQARNALDQARELVSNPWFTAASSDDRWRYFNYEANLAEWEGDLPRARDMHLEALKVPGTSLKWISGSEVNLGITYRKLFEQGHDPQDIERALFHGARAGEIKEAMGDYDELPVALHNWAWSQLVAVAAAKAQGGPDDAQAARLAAVLDTTERAVGVLNLTSSNKKRPQVYAERLAAHYMLAQAGRGDASAGRAAHAAFRDYMAEHDTGFDPADAKAIAARFADAGDDRVDAAFNDRAPAPELAPTTESPGAKKPGWRLF